MLQPLCALQAVAGLGPRRPRCANTNMPKTPLAVRLGEFAAELRFEELPTAVVDKAKAFVNHAVTVGLAGSANPR
jgi:hypothetical protein